jgi:hypothetical protein
LVLYIKIFLPFLFPFGPHTWKVLTQSWGYKKNQVHATPALNANAAPLGPESNDANPLLDYDGAAVIEARSFEQLTVAFQDDYYQTVIAEDEKKFLDKAAGVLRARGEAKRII